MLKTAAHRLRLAFASLRKLDARFLRNMSSHMSLSEMRSAGYAQVIMTNFRQLVETVRNFLLLIRFSSPARGYPIYGQAHDCQWAYCPISPDHNIRRNHYRNH